MPTRSARLAALLLATAALAACDRETPQQRAAREAARRDACIADELLIAARNRLSDLETLLRNAEAGGSAVVATLDAPRVFATAMNGYAQARSSALAYADSAMRAETPEDSARFAEAGRRFTVAPGAPGSVEGNVARRWQEDFNVARANPSHPCNQPREEEEK